MPKRTDYTPVINGLLKLIALGGITATVLVAPNTIQLFDKPLKNFYRKMDARQRERELRRALSYMKTQRLITDNYEHGLRLTDKARRRLSRAAFESISVPAPNKWDKKWRIVFFDIPEPKKSQRDSFAGKLRQLGFKVLQRSVFVHPFPSRAQVEQIASHYKVEAYVTYVEAGYIDNQKLLIKHFHSVIKS